MLGHGVAQLAPELEGVFGSCVGEQGGVLFFLPLKLGGVASISGRGGEGLGVGDGVGAGEKASVNAGEEGVGAEAVGPVDGVVGLAGGEDAGDVGVLVEVDPEAAHGVVHAGEDLHGDVAWIIADELLIDFEYAFKFTV